MLTRKDIEDALTLSSIVGDYQYMNGVTGHALAKDALAKHDALLEIYHQLGGEGEPKDVAEACKKQAQYIIDSYRSECS